LFKDGSFAEVGTVRWRLREKLSGDHPFPGPGLGIRILGDVTAEKVKTNSGSGLHFLSNGFKSIHGLYDSGLAGRSDFASHPIRLVLMGDNVLMRKVVA